jgi:hypothetical protein
LDKQCCAKGSEVLAKAYMSLAVIIAQFPVGGDQLHPDSPYEDSGSTGSTSDWVALEMVFIFFFVLFVGMPLGAAVLSRVLYAIFWILGKEGVEEEDADKK